MSTSRQLSMSRLERHVVPLRDRYFAWTLIVAAGLTASGFIDEVPPSISVAGGSLACVVAALLLVHERPYRRTVLTHDFENHGEWDNTVAIPASAHGKGQYPFVQVWQVAEDGGSFEVVFTGVNVSSEGDVTIDVGRPEEVHIIIT